jgi:hypothetical protein
MKILAFPEQVQLNPRNFEDFRFVRDFITPRAKLEVQTDKLILVNEDYKRLKKWIYEEQGRFENVEANVVDDTNNIFPHFLDLDGIQFTNNEVQVSLMARKGFEHFYQKSEGLTFEYLHYIGGLPSNLFLDVAYLIIPNDLNLQKIVSLNIEISIVYQLSQLILEAAKLVGDASNPFTITNAVIKGIAIAIQVVSLTIQFATNSNILKELYFPRLRNLKACSDYTLIKKGCEYLGYTLDSQALLDLRYNATLPIPQMNPNESIFQKIFNELGDAFNNGFPTLSDSCPTLWSLIDEYCKTYNLRCFVYNGVVKIEKRSYFFQNANIQIKPTYSEQGTRESVWEFNDEEVYFRKYYHYISDYTDLHAVNQIPLNVRYSERQTKPLSVINQDLVNLKDLNEYVIPFDLGAVKTELTGIEKIVSSVFGIFDSIANFFGGNSNMQSSITDRLGVLTISQQFFQQTKRLRMATTGNKQASDYLQQLSINNIIDGYHSDLKVSNNCKKVSKMTIPFTQQKFNLLQQNNFVTLTDGTVVEIGNIVYYDRKYKADVVIYQDDTSGFNVTEEIIIP